MITPIQSNGINSLNVERIRVPRRINFKGTSQIQQTEQSKETQDKFTKQTVK